MGTTSAGSGSTLRKERNCFFKKIYLEKKGVGSRSVVETSCAAPWTAQGGCRDHYLSYLYHVMEVGVGPGPVDGPKGGPLGLHHVVVPAAGSWVRGPCQMYGWRTNRHVLERGPVGV